MSDFAADGSQTKFKVGVCQILVGSDKQENITKASNSIDATNDANLVVRKNMNSQKISNLQDILRFFLNAGIPLMACNTSLPMLNLFPMSETPSPISMLPLLPPVRCC